MNLPLDLTIQRGAHPRPKQFKAFHKALLKLWRANGRTVIAQQRLTAQLENLSLNTWKGSES